MIIFSNAPHGVDKLLVVVALGVVSWRVSSWRASGELLLFNDLPRVEPRGPDETG